MIHPGNYIIILQYEHLVISSFGLRNITFSKDIIHEKISKYCEFVKP